MLIHERINQILKQKNIKKKDFALKFMQFDPSLKSTGQAPSLPTIYNYLNGTREIKADLVSAMAKALEVSEQELFMDDDSYLEFISDFMQRLDGGGYEAKDRIVKIIKLCEYAPTPLLDKIIATLEKSKEMTLKQVQSVGI